MALKKTNWTFRDKTNPERVIVVHDQKSLDVLSEVLREHANVWIFKEEEIEVAEPLNVSPVIPLPTPVPPPIHAAELVDVSVPPPFKASPPKKHEERRAQKRFNVELRIILVTQGRSFRSHSQDVSLGGMKLKNRIPAEFFKEKVTAYISHIGSKENIEMVCQVIPDHNDAKRLQFSDADAQQLKRLSKWLTEKENLRKAG